MRSALYWFRMLLLTAAIVTAVQLAQGLQLIGENSTLVSAGIAFIVMMLFGVELWPGVLLAALVTGVLNQMPLVLVLLLTLTESVIVVCVYVVQRGAHQYSVGKQHQIEQTLHARENSSETFQERLKTLHEVSNELTKAGTLENLCRLAVELGRSRLGFDRLGLWFFDEHDPRYTVGTFGTDAHGQTRDEHHMRVPFAKVPMIEQAVRTHSLIYTQEPFEIVESTGTRTGWNVIAVLYDGDKNLGWLSADNYLHAKPLTVFDVELLRLYGLTIGHLCTRYRAEDALRQSEEEARQFQMQLVMLNEISLALNRAATFDDLCRMAVEMGRSRMGFERLSLWFYHPETRAMHGSFGTDVTGQTVDERGVSWKVAEVGEPDPLRMRELLNGELPVNVHYEAPLTDADKHTLGRGWLVLAPLHDGGKIIGTVSADNLISHKPLPKYQIELLQLYSSTVGHLCAKKRAEEQLIDLAGERERVRILTDFIRDASHEFRTPLSIVYTKLYLLEKNVDPSAMAAHLRGIQDQADTIFKLVESLVLMSQLDSGVDFHFSSVNIAQILQGVVSQPRLAAEAKKVELKLDVRDHLPPVRADVEKLYRALHNLVENAVRYTSVGRIYVTADLLSDHRVCIRIQDTGVGINELDLPHIFKRFYRADKAHSTRGLGLGLPISRKIIEQHGGTISAESIVNVGTTITVTLPVESAD